MKIKCEYGHNDVKRLIIRDLQEKFPGLVAAENVLVGGEQMIEVEVTLAAATPVPVVPQGAPDHDAPLRPHGPEGRAQSPRRSP